MFIYINHRSAQNSNVWYLIEAENRQNHKHQARVGVHHCSTHCYDVTSVLKWWNDFLRFDVHIFIVWLIHEVRIAAYDKKSTFLNTVCQRKNCELVSGKQS